jgi:hypothetical protein
MGVNPSPVQGGRSRTDATSHIPALCELRDVGVCQTHIRALRRERIDKLTTNLKKWGKLRSTKTKEKLVDEGREPVPTVPPDGKLFQARENFRVRKAQMLLTRVGIPESSVVY